MICIYCGKKIRKSRLKVLPDTKTCVLCSEEQECTGIPIWQEETSELVICKYEEVDIFRKSKRHGEI